MRVVGFKTVVDMEQDRHIDSNLGTISVDPADVVGWLREKFDLSREEFDSLVEDDGWTFFDRYTTYFFIKDRRSGIRTNS